MLYLFLACGYVTTVFGQDNRVLVENARHSTDTAPVVLVKWYTKELVIPEGVNLYRKEATSLNWEKLNTTPIVKKQSAAPGLMVNDPDLDMFVEIIRKAKPQELQEEMLFFNVLVKSIQSNILADFMGIYYEDKSVHSGATYEYKVNRIKAGKEYLLGVSQPIRTGHYTPAAPVQNVTSYQKGKTLALNWKHEEDRYYAVNIYRKSDGDSVFMRLNTNPMILSKNPDSLGNLAYPKPMFSEDIKLQEGVTYTYKLAGVGFFWKRNRILCSGHCKI